MQQAGAEIYKLRNGPSVEGFVLRLPTLARARELLLRERPTVVVAAIAIAVYRTLYPQAPLGYMVVVGISNVVIDIMRDMATDDPIIDSMSDVHEYSGLRAEESPNPDGAKCNEHIAANPECAICGDDNRDRKKLCLPCNHTFDKDCLLEWLKADKYNSGKYDQDNMHYRCPLCRDSFVRSPYLLESKNEEWRVW